MRILVTSASRPFPRKLAASLGRDNDILLTDRAPASANGNFVRCELSHDRATRDLVSGVDAIVHWGQVDPESDDADALDFQTRSTYNLLRAAAEEGVSRCIYLSSLRILEDYDEHLDVNEHWKPRPTTDVPQLGTHLGECVCREFARERNIDIICLRLGDLAWNEGRSPESTSALFPEDAAQAVQNALALDLRDSRPSWRIFHIQSAVPNARFPTAAARQILGFTPAQRSENRS